MFRLPKRRMLMVPHFDKVSKLKGHVVEFNRLVH